MSDTPETDKVWKAGIKMSSEESEDFLRQHAERLERELNKVREKLKIALYRPDTESDQIGPCKRPDLCLIDHGHIPCPVCPNRKR